MNVRVALIFLVFGFVGLLLVMGVWWLLRSVMIRYPRRGFFILVAPIIGMMVVGSAIVIAMEMREQPSDRPNDLVTLQEPVVGRTIAAD